MVDNDVFSALANPVRREVLGLLRGGPMTAGAIAGRFELSRPAVSEHLRVLRLAGLVHENPSGRKRYYELAPEGLTAVSAWLHPFERYWRDRLTSLSDVLDADEKEQP